MREALPVKFRPGALGWYKMLPEFYAALFEEAHTRWHEGSSYEEVCTCINDFVMSFWKNTGHPDPPHRWGIRAWKFMRQVILKEGYGAKFCQKGRLAVCEKKRDWRMEGASER